jgi:hypothetical protein
MARRRTELVKADADRNLLPQERAPRVPAARESVGGIEFVEEGEFVEEPSGPGGVLAERPEDVLAEPPDARDISAELAAPPRRKLPWLTLVLAACVVAAGAFSGGALVEKHQLKGSTTAGRGFTFPTTSGSAGATGGRTFGGFGGASGAGSGTAGGAAGVTTGTVKLVDGNTIYVSDAQGNIVKVTTGGSTKVTESKSGKVSDLKAGQSVTVLGSKKSNGDVTATTVTQGGSTGGFGGFGARAGGASAGSAGGSTGGGN